MGLEKLLHADAGVEEAVEDVGKDVDYYQQNADKKDGAHDYREIVLVEPIDNDDSHAFPVEDVFHKDSTSQKTCKPARGRGDNRVQGVAQGVVEYHPAARKTLGPRGADVVLRKDFEHAVLGELCKRCQRSNAQCKGWKNKVFQVEIFACAVVVNGVEVAEHVEVSPVGQDISE